MQEKSASTLPGKPSLKLPAVLERHLGQDPILKLMVDERYPLTAEAYIDLNWFGERPEELDPEEQEIIDALNALAGE